MCDWATPLPADVLLARHYPGDGVIDFESLTRAVMDAGYSGDVEVEIFNERIWADDPAAVAARTARAWPRTCADAHPGLPAEGRTHAVVMNL